MLLRDITPQPVYSLIERTSQADLPFWVVAVAIIAPAVAFDLPYQWVYFVVGIAAGIAANMAASRWRHRLRIRDAFTPPMSFPDPPETDLSARIARWKELLGRDDVTAFILFSYGTCVVSVEAGVDHVELARMALRGYGHAVPGTNSADMLVYALPGCDDFVVGGHHPNMMTYVPRHLLSASIPPDRVVTAAGFLGRDLRVLDTFALDVVHVEEYDRPPT